MTIPGEHVLALEGGFGGTWPGGTPGGYYFSQRIGSSFVIVSRLDHIPLYQNERQTRSLRYAADWPYARMCLVASTGGFL